MTSLPFSPPYLHQSMLPSFRLRPPFIVRPYFGADLMCVTPHSFICFVILSFMKHTTAAHCCARRTSFFTSVHDTLLLDSHLFFCLQHQYFCSQFLSGDVRMSESFRILSPKHRRFRFVSGKVLHLKKHVTCSDEVQTSCTQLNVTKKTFIHSKNPL